MRFKARTWRHGSQQRPWLRENGGIEGALGLLGNNGDDDGNMWSTVERPLSMNGRMHAVMDLLTSNSAESFEDSWTRLPTPESLPLLRPHS